MDNLHHIKRVKTHHNYKYHKYKKRRKFYFVRVFKVGIFFVERPEKHHLHDPQDIKRGYYYTRYCNYCNYRVYPERSEKSRYFRHKTRQPGQPERAEPCYYEKRRERGHFFCQPPHLCYYPCFCPAVNHSYKSEEQPGHYAVRNHLQDSPA